MNAPGPGDNRTGSGLQMAAGPPSRADGEKGMGQMFPDGALKTQRPERSYFL